MGSVVDSLKRLYKKIGGGKVKGPIAIDDLVDKIADQMSSGGSGGSGSGDSNLFVINGMLNEDQAAYMLDKTYEDIHAAYISGKTCVIRAGTDQDAYDSIVSISSDSLDSIYRIKTTDAAYEASAPNQYPSMSTGGGDK